MRQYVKKPIPIKAEQFKYVICKKSDETYMDYLEPMSEYLQSIIESGKIYRKGDGYYVKTLEGDMFVEPGSYIIEGIKGEIYSCKQDIFKETYDKIDE